MSRYGKGVPNVQHGRDARATLIDHIHGFYMKFSVLIASLCTMIVAVAAAKTQLPGPRNDSSSVVKVSVSSSLPDESGKQTVTVTIDIDKGCHIFANPVKNEDLEFWQTRVKITSENKLANIKVEYPPGSLRTQNKETWMLYEGKISIPVVVQRARGDSGPLFVDVNYCAFVETIHCTLLPVRERFKLPLP